MEALDDSDVQHAEDEGEVVVVRRDCEVVDSETLHALREEGKVVDAEGVSVGQPEEGLQTRRRGKQ